MTVCIGAICNEGKHLVVVTDRMFTSPLGVEFEVDEPKIEELGAACVALAAGNTAPSVEILSAVREKLRETAGVKYRTVVDTVRQEYIILRSRKVFENHVIPMLGPDYLEFREKGVSLPNYLQPQPGQYNNLVAMSNAFNLGAELLIAGIDETGAHISQITHPGSDLSLDKLGHAAIGSGAIHAIMYFSLAAQTSHKSLAETLYNVYYSKKLSEAAPGVGTVTDMAVISSNGIKRVSPDMIKVLDELSEASIVKTLPDLTALQEVIDAEAE